MQTMTALDYILSCTSVKQGLEMMNCKKHKKSYTKKKLPLKIY